MAMSLKTLAVFLEKNVMENYEECLVLILLLEQLFFLPQIK